MQIQAGLRRMMMKKRVLCLGIACILAFSQAAIPVFAVETDVETGEVLDSEGFFDEDDPNESEPAMDEAKDQEESAGEMSEQTDNCDDKTSQDQDMPICDDDVEQSEADDTENGEESNENEDSIPVEKSADEENTAEGDESESVSENESVSANGIIDDVDTYIQNDEMDVSTVMDYMSVKSSDAVNQGIFDCIASYKSIYPEGTSWNTSYDGGKQCFGFAMLMADKVFGCHPKNTQIRNAKNGAVSNGWTCYYVNSGNAGSLPVEPGDLIDSPTSASASHTAMVLSVNDNNIICVQCNLSGNCKVYWTQNFNYNRKNATLQQIYSRFGGYGTIRLWKPNESLKSMASHNTVVVDTEAPRVGEVLVDNTNDFLTYSCTASDNVGIKDAWAVVTASNGKSKKFDATVAGSQISGTWSPSQISASSTVFSVAVYAQDSAGNTGSSITSVDLEFDITVTPEECTIEV